jgi:hypothetical protein
MADQVIELIKPWGLNPAGALISPPANIATELIRAGRAKAIEQEVPQPKKSQKATRITNADPQRIL